jgi:hypothetical protein
MRYLLFALALIGSISAAAVPIANAGSNDKHHHCYQNGNDDFQGNENCQ